MSHPSHELQPAEHQLSQEVLEFLIEHQDWFMLDTPPPPALPPTPSRSLTPPLTAQSPGASVSVSDDEGPDGWRIIDRRPRPLTADRGNRGVGTSAAGRAIAAPGIVRSRTVPSPRKGRASTVDSSAMQRGTGASGSAPNPTLLRKARRASAQPV